MATKFALATTSRDGKIGIHTIKAFKMATPMSLQEYRDTLHSRLSTDSQQFFANRFGTLERGVKQRGWQFSPTTLADHLAELATAKPISISKSTLRSYKSFALFWLATKAGAEDDAEAITAFERIQNISVKEMPSKANPNSGTSKKFPVEAIQLLEEIALSDTRSPNIAPLLTFVKINTVLGLRPFEYLDCSLASYLVRDKSGKPLLNKGKPVYHQMLCVENAKHSHGRANGPRREILLDNMTTEFKTELVNFLKYINDTRETMAEADDKKFYQRFWKPLSDSLSRLIARNRKKARLVLDKPLSLYSTRHQAIATAKKNGLSKVEIAALFGHSSTETARKHYGRKTDGRSGGGGGSIFPSAESIAAVTGGRPVLSPEKALPKLQEWFSGGQGVALG